MMTTFQQEHLAMNGASNTVSLLVLLCLYITMWVHWLCRFQINILPPTMPPDNSVDSEPPIPGTEEPPKKFRSVGKY